MTIDNFKRLVNKYAIILIIAYTIGIVVNLILQNISIESIEKYTPLYYLIVNSGMIIQFIFNIMAVIFIIKDFSKYGMKNNVVIIATLVFSVFGICMFLLLVNRKLNKANA